MNQLLSRIAGLMIASSFVFAPLSAQAENAPAKTKVNSKAKKQRRHQSNKIPMKSNRTSRKIRITSTHVN